MNRRGELTHEESHGNADLVAHFYRRAFNLLRKGGTFGLIATNTIAQGDTRSTGLLWIRKHGGTIFAALKRIKWPGEAAVVVSLVHIFKGLMGTPFSLDGKTVSSITAFLLDKGSDESPSLLVANRGLAFKGCELGSVGFLITRSDESAAELFDIDDPRNGEKRLVKLYLGGDEINVECDPVRASRFVIDTDGLTREMIESVPEALRFLSQRVLPDMIGRGLSEPSEFEWWHFRRPSIGFRAAAAAKSRLIVAARHQPHWAITFVPSTAVLAESLVVFGFDGWTAFTLLQSRTHEEWVRLLGSSLEDRLRYTPTDCFETFPLPATWDSNSQLESAGRKYFDLRAAIMVRVDEGLTRAYNRFHDPDERDPDIRELRNLHADMDRAVLDAYGWTDIQPTCEFILDYEDEEDDATAGRATRRKKPWRYRWPDEIRDEVLGRLLALNAKRAAAEQVSGAAAQRSGSRRRKSPRGASNTPLLEAD